MSIKVLSKQESSAIAAGEVVERPASIVKELVENSIDAGADTIVIHIESGGIKAIAVSDNGSGIASNDVELAFHRFATSKYPENGDLFGIETLGFRGEALPSIASVASIRMVTRVANEQNGTSVHIDNGNLIEVSSIGCPLGTTVTVTNLFARIPARLKFLKSPSVESQRIHSLVQQLSMAFPLVSFRFDVDGKIRLNTRGNGDLRNTYAEIFDPRTADSMMVVESGKDFGYATIYGLISSPDTTRSNRHFINLVVNGRCVQNRSLAFAVEDAYKGFLTVGRHPLSFLFIDVPKEDLDFNVHPAKVEIRLKDENQVFRSIQRLIRNALISMSPVPYTQFMGVSPAVEHDVDDGLAYKQSTESYQQSLSLFNDQNYYESETNFKFQIRNLRLVGQINGLYIVGETDEAIYLIDQHAAHERILYEQVQDVTKVDRQGILEPIVLRLSPENEQVLTANLDYWGKWGFDIEYFGSHSYLLRSVPSVFGNVDPGKEFLSILDDLLVDDFFGEGISHDWQLKICASIACHSAVKAGDILSGEEMQNLLAMLQSVKQPNNCAHGRPTTIKFGLKELEKEFRRT
ncbi:MAG: DNA mismatch repair endonuclease MutL [SAR202 cluster bacterium]|nr:DNA mismatch repair endonuclease MutL [SAR202 cluster bacterium]|tara:strand:+ start:16111 stop:17838 length:1728 start_codon:yes stop_codon:yes gene_type:complete